MSLRIAINECTVDPHCRRRRHANSTHWSGARSGRTRWSGRVCFDRTVEGEGTGLAETICRKESILVRGPKMQAVKRIVIHTENTIRRPPSIIHVSTHSRRRAENRFSRAGKAKSLVGNCFSHAGKVKSHTGNLFSCAGKVKSLAGNRFSCVRKVKSLAGNHFSSIGKAKSLVGNCFSHAEKVKSHTGNRFSCMGKPKSHAGNPFSVGKSEIPRGEDVSGVRLSCTGWLGLSHIQSQPVRLGDESDVNDVMKKAHDA